MSDPVSEPVSSEEPPTDLAGDPAAGRTCAWCGRHEDDPARTLSWSTAVERGRSVAYCDGCSREHLRSMEGKLDSDFW